MTAGGVFHIFKQIIPNNQKLSNLKVPASTKYLASVAIMLVLLTLPLWASNYIILLLFLSMLYMSFGQMWNLLAGYAGLVSLGQQIFIGLGGYSLAVLTEFYGLPIWFAVLAGGIFACLFALISAKFLFRMKGVFFTIATWITAEAVLVYFSNWRFVRMGQGMFIRAAYPLSTSNLYYIALGISFGSVLLVWWIMRSKLGLGLMAMRDNDDAAETVGVEIFRSKIICYLVASFVTGMIGSVFYLNQVFIQPYAAFSITWTVAVVFLVIIGGIGTIEGPILGAVIYVLLQQYLSAYAGLSMLILGGIALVLILVAPRGIIGTLQEKTGFQLFSFRRT
jgi:branched-chain amino acid transport system permease protein